MAWLGALDTLLAGRLTRWHQTRHGLRPRAISLPRTATLTRQQVQSFLNCLDDRIAWHKEQRLKILEDPYEDTPAYEHRVAAATYEQAKTAFLEILRQRPRSDDGRND